MTDSFIYHILYFLDIAETNQDVISSDSGLILSRDVKAIHFGYVRSDCEEAHIHLQTNARVPTLYRLSGDLGPFQRRPIQIHDELRFSGPSDRRVKTHHTIASL